MGSAATLDLLAVFSDFCVTIIFQILENNCQESIDTTPIGVIIGVTKTTTRNTRTTENETLQLSKPTTTNLRLCDM